MHRVVIRSRVARLVPRTLVGALAVAVVLAGCLDDTPVAAISPRVRATLHANVVGAMAGGTVLIRVGYRNSRQGLVPLPSSPQQITLAAGTTVVVPVTVDIGPCLKDLERQFAEEPGCQLTIELTLVDAAGEVIDTQTLQSETSATPGQSIDFGSVTIGISVSAITVAPTSLTLSVPQEQQLTATVRDAKGAAITTVPVTWTTSDVTVAQFGATTGNSATVRALKLGTATVTATAGGKTSNAVTVNVVPPPPLTIRQRPAAGCIIVGQTVTVEVDTPPGPVTWTSSNANVATVGASTGVVTGVAIGNATVSATSGARTGSASICVIALRAVLDNLAIVAGRTAQISVSGATGGTVSFGSSAAAIATVSANGLIRGVTVGQATITVKLTAASGTEEASFPITVTAGSIAITPTSAAAPIGGSARFTAVVRDADGVTLPGVVATWTIADPSIGSLSVTSGTTVDVRATKIGTTTVRGTAGGVTASASFTATQSPLGSRHPSP
jgi:uncharacterized protein YjdB